MHHQTLATYFTLTSGGLTQNVSYPDFFNFPYSLTCNAMNRI